MKDTNPPKRDLRKLFSRRNFLFLSGGALAAAAGTSLLPGAATPTGASTAAPIKAATQVPNALPPGFVKPAAKRYALAATDGWISLPTTTTIPFHPDSLADASTGKTTYVFGFRDVTSLTDAQVLEQRGKAQNSAPLLYVAQEQDTYIKLTNLGLQQRPDLVDAHTIHWHGFRDAIPLFDGVPEMSIAVPISRDFTYFYRPHDPGTYMYHCHFEDVEHVQMGMVGVIFVTPAQNQGNSSKGVPVGKYVYNDEVPPTDPRSTAYNREFAFMLNELNVEAHYDDAHIQLFDWSEYKPDFALMNGRSYPDTLLGNFNPMVGGAAGSDAKRLQYQPISSLVTANSGDKVLLRFVNLGYEQHVMTIDGIKMKVVGKDAVYLKGRDGTNGVYMTNEVYLGPGESYDVIITAPTVATETTYLLYNRKYAMLHNGGKGLGGQMTEIRIRPGTSASNYPAQTLPNT